jgi:hypothetical protein
VTNTGITLKESFLNKLEPGMYFVTAVYTDGSIDLEFEVKASSGSNTLVWVAVAIVVIVLLALVALFLLRRRPRT